MDTVCYISQRLMPEYAGTLYQRNFATTLSAMLSFFLHFELMNACMLTYSYFEADNRVRRYADLLVKDGHEVEVICLEQVGAGICETKDNPKIFRIQKRVKDERSKFTYLTRILLFFIKSTILLSFRHIKKPFDIIHIHSVPDFLVFSAILPKLLGAKVILDIHDILPEFFASKFNKDKNSIIFKALLLTEKFSAIFADHIIIANHYWEGKISTRAGIKHKITTILNYPDPDIFYERKRVVDNARFVLMYPGSLNYHQGIDIAIQAFSLVKEKIPGSEFHIYGAGSEKDNLLELTSGLNLMESVKFNPMLSLEEIADKMSVSDLGIVPKRANSFGNEAFSTKIFEFMALGVPLVVANTFIDQYYFDDSMVFFFEAGDHEDLAHTILKAYNSKTRRQTMVNKSRNFIRENTWRIKGDTYRTVIRNLMDV